MALAALIAAYMQVEDGGEGLRATLPLVGRTLIEHQARLARHAGAGHLVVLIERMPAALTAALDRLRRDGIAVEVARSIADAADRIHPDEKLLLIGDGCLAGQPLLDRLVAAPVPTIVTVPDHSERQGFERIDAMTRWGGLALLDGTRLRRTAAMVGDWDLQSTLMRRAVQEGAARIDAFPPAVPGAPPPELLLIADRTAALDGIDRTLMSASRGRGRSWPERFLFPPIEELALRSLARSSVDPVWLAGGAVAAAVAGAAAAGSGWRWPALGLLLLSGPLAAVAARLAGTRLAAVRHAAALARARDAFAAAALLLLGWRLAGEAGWGIAVVSAAAVAAMVALRQERVTLDRLEAAAPPLWIASTDGLIWTLLPFAIAGLWSIGLAALALYALGSLFVVQRGVARQALARLAGR